MKKMSNDTQTPLQYFLVGLIDLEIGQLIPNDKLKELHQLYTKAREKEQDEKEAIIIKQCAETGTSNASAYSDGYKQGYQRALENMKYNMNDWIDKELTITK